MLSTGDSINKVCLISLALKRGPARNCAHNEPSRLVKSLVQPHNTWLNCPEYRRRKEKGGKGQEMAFRCKIGLLEGWNEVLEYKAPHNGDHIEERNKRYKKDSDELHRWKTLSAAPKTLRPLSSRGGPMNSSGQTGSLLCGSLLLSWAKFNTRGGSWERRGVEKERERYLQGLLSIRTVWRVEFFLQLRLGSMSNLSHIPESTHTLNLL